MKRKEMWYPDSERDEYLELEKIVDTYNDCIDKLEAQGYNVGGEYDGHMGLDYSCQTNRFYVTVEY